MKRCGTEQLLGLDKFVVDDEEAHIEIEKERCRACSSKPCCVACPAGLYAVKDGEIVFDYAGCLECGTCRLVCPDSADTIRWRYPRGGFGIQYRYG